MREKTAKKIARILFLLLLAALIGTVVSGVLPYFPDKTYAVGNAEFDTQNVLDDLLTSEVIDGASAKPFTLSDYAFDPNGRVRIINVVEYCYSLRQSVRAHYGLYLYVFNEPGIAIDGFSVQNKVGLAVGYNADGTPGASEKFGLAFCNSSAAAGYENMFYKFRVVDRKGADGKYLIDRVGSDERRYDLSGIELLTKGESAAEDYEVGGTYRFTGYAKGCGADPEAKSTLACSVTEFDYLHLDVRDTVWNNPVKSSSSVLGYSQKQVNSVYFSIPNTILSQYGTIDEIHAEYYLYQSNMILVTSDRELYQSMTNQKGVYVSGYNSDLYSLYSSDYSLEIAVPITHQWAFNPNPNIDVPFQNRVFQIPFVFFDEKNNIDEAVIPSSEVKKYMENYRGVNSGEPIPSKTNRYNSELFWRRNYDGYRNVRISAGDTFDLLTSGWDKFKQYGFDFDRYDDVVDHYGETPIKLIAASDLVASDDELSKNLFVSPGDVTEFREFASAQILLGRTPVLFRFRQGEYETSGHLSVSKNGAKIAESKSFVAYENMVLDFDIIDLTFVKDGVYHTIAAVSDPIDIIPDVTAPPKSEGVNWIKVLLGIVFAILAIVLLFPILKPVVKILWEVIKLPFKAVSTCVKTNKKTK